MSAQTVKSSREKRARRVRRRIRHDGPGKLRLSVFRSSKNISAQIIDDVKGETVAAASSLEADAKKGLKTGANKDAASEVGKLIAARARDKGVEEVVFDRGGYLYHGRVKALAGGLRQGGLKF